MQSSIEQRSALAVLGDRHRNVLPGEDVDLYDRLRAELEARYSPQTILEEMEVDHLLNTIWEIRRPVRIKPQVRNIDRKRALAELIQQTLFNHRIARVEDIEQANELAGAWFGTEEEHKKVDELLARFGLNADAVTAKIFVLNAATLEGIEAQIQLATARAYTIQGQLEVMQARRAQAQMQTKPLRLTRKGSGTEK